MRISDWSSDVCSSDLTASSGGRFIRSESQFRDVITGDGGQYPAEPDRYHLYVAMACPWAHRALIMRALKGLENFVSVSVVHWLMLDKGWTFEEDRKSVV